MCISDSSIAALCACGCGRPAKPDKRGLSRCCYDDRALREDFDPLRDTNNRFEFPDTNEFRPIPIQTNTWPGSDKRIEVLMLRASLYQSLHSPQDLKLSANSLVAEKEEGRE